MVVILVVATLRGQADLARRGTSHGDDGGHRSQVVPSGPNLAVRLAHLRDLLVSSAAGTAESMMQRSRTPVPGLPHRYLSRPRARPAVRTATSTTVAILRPRGRGDQVMQFVVRHLHGGIRRQGYAHPPSSASRPRGACRRRGIGGRMTAPEAGNHRHGGGSRRHHPAVRSRLTPVRRPPGDACRAHRAGAVRGDCRRHTAGYSHRQRWGARRGRKRSPCCCPVMGDHPGDDCSPREGDV